MATIREARAIQTTRWLKGSEELAFLIHQPIVLELVPYFFANDPSDPLPQVAHKASCKHNQIGGKFGAVAEFKTVAGVAGGGRIGFHLDLE